jgi:hypothetical protein
MAAGWMCGHIAPSSHQSTGKGASSQEGRKMDTTRVNPQRSRLSCERPAHAKSDARLTMLFTGLLCWWGFSWIFVVGAVAYDDIYIHPADPLQPGRPHSKFGAPTKPTSVLRSPLAPPPMNTTSRVKLPSRSKPL